jgi:hypothetical protein
MTTYRLLSRDGTVSYRKIVTGRKWVGRVYHSRTDNLFHGKIGTLEATGASEVEAFDEVVARRFGHADAASLRAANARVRANNKAVRAKARAFADEYLNAKDLKGRFDALDKMIDCIDPHAK